MIKIDFDDEDDQPTQLRAASKAAETVVDLTLSDDEGSPDPPPAKRPRRPQAALEKGLQQPLDPLARRLSAPPPAPSQPPASALRTGAPIFGLLDAGGEPIGGRSGGLQAAAAAPQEEPSKMGSARGGDSSSGMPDCLPAPAAVRIGVAGGGPREPEGGSGVCGGGPLVEGRASDVPLRRSASGEVGDVRPIRGAERAERPIEPLPPSFSGERGPNEVSAKAAGPAAAAPSGGSHFTEHIGEDPVRFPAPVSDQRELPGGPGEADAHGAPHRAPTGRPAAGEGAGKGSGEVSQRDCSGSGASSEPLGPGGIPESGTPPGPTEPAEIPPLPFKTAKRAAVDHGDLVAATKKLAKGASETARSPAAAVPLSLTDAASRQQQSNVKRVTGHLEMRIEFMLRSVIFLI